MNQILRYLGTTPIIGFELILASLFVNLLALSSSLFVTLVLQRYVSYGVSTTLVTLTTGVLIAILFEYLLRNARLKLAAILPRKNLQKLGAGAFGMLTTADYGALSNVPDEQKTGITRALDRVSSSYAAANLCALLDLPFALLFVFVIYLFNPLLAMVAVPLIGFAVLVSWIGQIRATKMVKDYEQQIAISGALNNRMALAKEAARCFDPELKLLKKWQDQLPQVRFLQNRLALLQGRMQNRSIGLQALLTVIMIGYGATLVVSGELAVSALIGANILASRALGPFLRVAQLAHSFANGDNAARQLRSLAKLPAENNRAAPLQQFSGGLEFHDLGFSYPESPSPLVEHLDLTLKPGEVLVVTGGNGSGKTTLARLVLGLLSPTRGQILADGASLNQLPARWWRQQIAYFPQRPSFIGGTIGENITLVNPALEGAALQALVRQAGLDAYLKRTSEGLDAVMTIGGDNLSYGIARRVAFARALAGGGPVLLFDEPTEGLDKEGCTRVYSALNLAVQQRKTIIACSNDAQVLKGASYILDLDQKPKPGLVRGSGGSMNPSAKKRIVARRVENS